MNEELKELLQTNYQYEVEAQLTDATEAEAALQSGEMARYFDLSVYLQLADTCWVLEKWDEAKHWYRHNARLLMEKRSWHSQHSGSDYPIDAISDWEASTLVKAGDLTTGKEHLKQVIPYWQNQPGSALVLTQLSLHAAQAGLSELAVSTLASSNTSQPQKTQNLFIYQSAQMYLLMRQWDKFLEHVQNLPAATLTKDTSDLETFTPLEEALKAASLGLKTLASLYTGSIEPAMGREVARQAFETAMLYFYQFNSQVDWNFYFMRLNTRFADELAANQPLNPNPFADLE